MTLATMLRRFEIPRPRAPWRGPLPSLLVLLSSVSTAAGAEVVSLDWDATGRFERSVGVAAGEFVEACGRLTRGQTITWAFESSRPLLFNVHFHSGPEVVYPEKRDASSRASGTLAVETDQDHCWMWTNRSGQASTLHFSVNRS